MIGAPYHVLPYRNPREDSRQNLVLCGLAPSIGSGLDQLRVQVLGGILSLQLRQLTKKMERVWM